VGDVKYKALPESEVVHSDLYQLLAYVIPCDLPGGLLVYGSGGEVITHDVERAGKTLEVVSMNLSESPEQILRSTENLAKQIETLRASISQVRGSDLAAPGIWRAREEATG
jgi:hypothetical protein